MIYVCQGHESSIAIEIFVKSFMLLDEVDQNKFVLIVNKKTLELNLELLNLDFAFNGLGIDISGNQLNLILTDINSSFPQSTSSLNTALSEIRKNDILLTLPTSKDQLVLDQVYTAGYTEFFRKYFELPEISMMFSSSSDQVLLITDHIPLSDVSHKISSEFIYNKVKITLNGYNKYFNNFDEVIFAGINPHVGENGILGKEDNCIAPAIKKLSPEFNKIKFLGPVSGDTLYFHKKNDKRQLFVYMYHDQGLPFFKAQNGTIGLNISMGLPFLRISVDHGTAFELHGKNKANYLGCLYMLNSALKANSKINRAL